MAGSCQHWWRRAKKNWAQDWTHNLQIISPTHSTDCAKSLFGVPVWIKSCSIDPRNKQSPTCEVLHETKENSLQTSPTESCLAQSVEHETDDLEVVGSIPGTGNFILLFSFNAGRILPGIGRKRWIIEKLEYLFTNFHYFVCNIEMYYRRNSQS